MIFRVSDRSSNELSRLILRFLFRFSNGTRHASPPSGMTVGFSSSSGSLVSSISLELVREKAATRLSNDERFTI